MSGRIVGWLAIAALLSPLAARGFEAQKHAEFSQDALFLFKMCTGRFVSGDATLAFASGAKAEDDWTPSRGVNWHFYGNHGAIGTYRCGLVFCCRGSNERIFAERREELDAAIAERSGEEAVFEAAGRVAHHIQDMASPPHVVPIFHTGKDLFDKYVPSEVWNVADGDVCKAVLSGAPSFEALLEEAAQETRKLAFSEVEFADGQPSGGETWGRFWGGGPDPKRRGFVTYGELGNTFTAGLEGSDEKRKRYDLETLDRFFDGHRRRAVIDTARLLVHLDALRRGGASPAGR